MGYPEAQAGYPAPPPGYYAPPPAQQGYYPPPPAAYGYPPPPPVEYDTYVAPPYVVAPGPYYAGRIGAATDRTMPMPMAMGTGAAIGAGEVRDRRAGILLAIADPSCPRLSRASTSYLAAKQKTPGR